MWFPLPCTEISKSNSPEELGEISWLLAPLRAEGAPKSGRLMMRFPYKSRVLSMGRPLRTLCRDSRNKYQNKNQQKNFNQTNKTATYRTREISQSVLGQIQVCQVGQIPFLLSTQQGQVALAQIQMLQRR
mmetsp:Transcript_23493/g.53961  ORF Transcript_23493/g.53961 Transcript_23493/m.53961 type:complete len:130 (-) Transcript_23493:1078-1467(-)